MIHLQDINKTYQGAQPLHVLKGLNDTKHVSVNVRSLEFCVSVARKLSGILLGPESHVIWLGPLLSTNPAGQVVVKCLCPSQKNVDSNSWKNLKEGENRSNI